MGEGGEAGRARERRAQVRIDPGDESGNRLGALFQSIEDRGFPLAPVMDQRPQVSLRLEDRAAVAGQ